MKIPFLFSLTIIASIATAQYQTATQQSQIDAVRDYFDSQGFVLLRGFFNEDNKNVLKTWKVTSSDLFNRIFQDLYARGITEFPQHARVIDIEGESKLEYAMGEGGERGYKEIVMNHPGSYEISLSRIGSQVSADPLVEQLRAVIPSLLGQDFGNMTGVNWHMSLIMATSYAAEQSWHVDGEHLDMAEHQRVHSLKVYVPLVDVTDQRGPIEMYPASHYVTRQESLMKIDPNALKAPYAPALMVGDILVIDDRLLHREKPNLSKVRRPMLVFSFSHVWFKDAKNWPTRSIYDAKEF